MSFRLSFQGDPKLSGVAASVVERLARDSGLHEEEAREIADATLAACERASGGSEPFELLATPRGIRLDVAVAPGASGSVEVHASATAPRRRKRT